MSRRHTPRLAAVGVAWLVALVGCTPSDDDADALEGTGPSILVEDAVGRTVALDAPARRIVSLVPSATQTLRAMGVDSLLIGRTDYDTDAWVQSLPSVGGGLEPNMEALVALGPDLVVRFGGEQDPRTPDRLDELGIPHLAVRPDGVEDIYETARLLGRVTHEWAAAEALIDEIRHGLEELAARTEALPRRRIAYVMGGTPPWIAGPGTYIDQIVSLVGGDNVFSDVSVLYTSVSPEELRTREIDVVLTPGGENFDSSLTPGARIEVIGSALEIPGPDVVEAATAVAEQLHDRSLR